MLKLKPAAKRPDPSCAKLGQIWMIGLENPVTSVTLLIVNDLTRNIKSNRPATSPLH
jgi:hypothetical protein